MRTSALFAAAALLLGNTAYAQDMDPGTIAEALFTQMDANGDDLLTLPEQADYDAAVMQSMDLNESGSVDMEEFLAWGFGFAAVAEQRGREDSYQTANRIIFKIMDYDDSDEVSLEEMNGFQQAAFAYSDQDQNDQLTPQEFHSHHFMNIAMQEALTPVE